MGLSHSAAVSQVLTLLNLGNALGDPAVRRLELNKDLSAARNAFVEEARELLTNMEKALLEIETEGPTTERINAVFRAAHTIKGSAGLFGLDLIVSFTHIMESVLDRVRNDEVILDAALIATSYSAVATTSRNWLTRWKPATLSEDPRPATTRAALLANKLQTHLRHSALYTGGNDSGRAMTQAESLNAMAMAMAPPSATKTGICRCALARTYSEMAWTPFRSSIIYLASAGSFICTPLPKTCQPPTRWMRKAAIWATKSICSAMPTRKRWKVSSSSCVMTVAYASCRPTPGCPGIHQR